MGRAYYLLLADCQLMRNHESHGVAALPPEWRSWLMEAGGTVKRRPWVIHQCVRGKRCCRGISRGQDEAPLERSERELHVSALDQNLGRDPCVLPEILLFVLWPNPLMQMGPFLPTMKVANRETANIERFAYNNACCPGRQR